MPPVVRRRMRYRKQYPGESKGITEEMRFVAMKLPNINGKKLSTNSNNFLLLTTMTVMVEMTIMPLPRTIARNRKPTATGVKRRLGGRAWKVLSSTWWIASSYSTPSSALSMNQTTSLEDWIGEMGESFGRSRLVEAAGQCDSGTQQSRSFLCQVVGGACRTFCSIVPLPLLQNLLFAYSWWTGHCKTGQDQQTSNYFCILQTWIGEFLISEKLLEGRELGFYTWEGDVQELLKGVREKLNKLGEHWTGDDKNKCFKEITKSFRYLGQIVRLIILEPK